MREVFDAYKAKAAQVSESEPARVVGVAQLALVAVAVPLGLLDVGQAVAIALGVGGGAEVIRRHVYAPETIEHRIEVAG